MVSYDFSRSFNFTDLMAEALPMTLSILFLPLFLDPFWGATWLGHKWEKTRVLQVFQGYIFTLRCTPPIVLLFLVFYGLPEFLKWWLNLDINNWSKTILVSFTMVLLFAAIVAEGYLRRPYQAIPRGQIEAGLLVWHPKSDILENHFSSSFSVGPSQYNDRYSKFDAGCCLSLYDWFCWCHGAWNLLISRNLGNYSWKPIRQLPFFTGVLPWLS